MSAGTDRRDDAAAEGSRRLPPGVHARWSNGRQVWVRVDSRGIVAMSTRGPHALARPPGRD